MGDHMVTDVAPRFAKLGVRRSDIMVVNFAVWINKAAELEENLSLWADFYRRERQRLPFVIWRDASVQHFDTPTGERAWRCMLQLDLLKQECTHTLHRFLESGLKDLHEPLKSDCDKMHAHGR